MALSFEDSLKSVGENSSEEQKAQTAQDTTSDIATTTQDDTNQVATAASYSMDVPVATADDAGWQQSNKYAYYYDYSDDGVSRVDDEKNISINSKQFNITQEKNSQFIPFEMPRFYDGFDLMNATLLIHFVNAEGYENYVNPVNVTFNDEKIKFAWLVGSDATAIEGKLEFELQAVGVNSRGEEYMWKSRTNGDLNVLKSLSGNGVVEPDESWITSFITQVTENVAYAQTAAQEAQAQASAAASYASAASKSATEAADTVEAAKSELAAEVDASVKKEVETTLSNYYTQTQIDEIVVSVDAQIDEVQAQVNNLDGLAKFNVQYDGSVMTFYNNTDVIASITVPSAEYIAAVDSKISDAKTEIQGKLDTINTDLGNIHDDIDGLPQTLATDYYNKTDADAKFATKTDLNTTNNSVSSMTTSVEANKQNISTLSNKVVEIEESVAGIDNSPKVTYDATYGEDYTYTLWEIEREGEGDGETRTPKSQFKIVGGGGGGGATSSTLKIEYVTSTPIVATSNDNVVIKYNFSGTDSSGDAVMEGTATWKVANIVVATNIAIAGENSFDVTEFLSLGTQKVNLTITDDAGSLVTKTWTVQKVDIRIESSFNDSLTYPIGAIAFDYTPYGAVAKTVHYILDGVEIGTQVTSVSGVPMAYELPQQTHGAHLLEVYITAEINGKTVESNHIVKDVIWYDPESTVPVIGCVQQNFTARQYDATNIIYTVYDPTTETPTVELAVDGHLVSTLTIDSNTQTWQYKEDEVGEHTLTITCGETVKTLTVNVEKLDIDLEPVTAGLAFDFNPIGKSNNDADRLWSNGTVAMSVSDNFDWVNGGYQIDDNGDQYFCVKAGTTAVVNYNLFADDAKRNGKEFKLIFKTANIKNASTTFLSCVDGSANSKIGLEMNVHEAYVHASAGNLYLPYAEEDIIEFEFNINKDTDEIPMVMGYEDGVATRPLVYSDSHDFTQVNPKYITIGSDECDVYVYRMKAYSTSLNDRGILNNFIADARNAEEMINRYTRNQIYDENNQLTPEILAERCPHLRIIKLEAPHFTNNKKDKVSNTKIQQIYKGGDPVLDNWTAYNAMHSGQGTTSNEYGAAGRNLDLIMNCDDVVDGQPYKSYFVLGDGVTQAEKVSFTRDSVEVDYMNVKVNIASSENANNALLAKRFNEFNPYIRPAKKNNPKVKDTMEFHNCVVFVRETDPDISTHREFNDCEWHYYSLGNVGDSKKTDKTRLDDPDDPLECIVEIMDNTLPNSTFQGDDAALATLEQDNFDEELTYGWRYSYDEDDPNVTQPCIDKWKEFYKFVVTSTDEEFKANLKDYFEVDTALFAYLFTTRYTMIDNRAKNTFWHYSKREDGVYRWCLSFAYDYDTALGCNNSGELTMTYGYEDTDYKTKGDASTGYAFNAATSTFFCRIRDLFVDELRDMFVQCESAGAWNADGLISQFDEWQEEFPEELWRLDIDRKYLRSYREGNPRFLNTMMNGKKKYQRRQFERSQEKYMATKFFGNVAVADQIMFRCNTPTGDNLVVKPDYTLHLTPYADMYLSVMFGSIYRTQVRAEAGKQYDIACPFETMDDTAVLVYGCSQIMSMGDISACYIHDNDFSKATKLQELIIGNATEGYANSFLTNLGIGNNKMLEKLDIQNTPNLTQAIDLSRCGNLRELYANGSGLTGVTFANGGRIQIAELPAVNAITVRNLHYLTDFIVSSYNNLTTLVVEGCPVVDARSIIEASQNINRIRITGVYWELDDTLLLDKIYNMAGIDKNGYNIAQSVLSGTARVPVVKQQQLYDYQDAWPDLEIIFNTMIEQYAVTFVNDDGTVLDVQYVDKGGSAVDPITRADNPIATPTKESTVSTDFTFDAWDSSLTSVFSDRTIKATYTESIRKYTIKYVSMGITLQESTGLYGENVLYNGDTPIYTLEEGAYKYYLFNRWDKSGLIDGDKVVNAVFDSFEYNTSAFEGRELNQLAPVEIYAITRLGLDNVNMDIQDGDDYSFELGYDVDFDDIKSEVVIAEKTTFDGTNKVDTGIKLFDVDRDFTLAIDYKMASESAQTSVLAQCFQSNGSNGFKIWNNGGVKLTWGASPQITPSSLDGRDIVVIRHKKGENNLTVYSSNLASSTSSEFTIERNKETITDSTLVFGCSKADDGAYEKYAIGDVYWSKLWYEDLGESACKKLVGWTHEEVSLEVCGFKNYYLSDNPSQRCNFTLLAKNLISREMPYNNANSNAGGWATSELNKTLNTRLYEAMPVQIKALLKKVTVWSSVGSRSNEMSSSDCYIAIPSAIEVSNDYQVSIEPYIYEGSTISYMISNEQRMRSIIGGDPINYWLRSPNASYANYIYQVDNTGNLYGFANAYNAAGVLIEISF